MSGGERIAAILDRAGVRFVFTLCGGHISPILVAAKATGIRVVDVRHEATAVFAADAVARLTGVPGVAVVTAGPGVTNTLTAIRNAQMAASPIVVIGGATATALRGRGSLQDIDQIPVVKPHVKAVFAPKTVPDLVDAVQEAFRIAPAGIPGPVFVEAPVDLLYDEALVRSWYSDFTPRGAGVADKTVRWYLERHADRLFTKRSVRLAPAGHRDVPAPAATQVRRAHALLGRAKRPVMVLGSDVVSTPGLADDVARAVRDLGVPVFLSGMARGLLDTDHMLQLRHKRKAALQEADLVLLGGMPQDFRMDYGRAVARHATIISVGRDEASLRRNRRPALAIHADPGRLLLALAGAGPLPYNSWRGWTDGLKERDLARVWEIEEQGAVRSRPLNPIALSLRLEAAMSDDAVIVVDGGDFVATASYVISPRGPLSWLDPGPFGTLGVGAGFALAAALVRPEAEVWLLYGDGSSGYSIAEFDTFTRHGLGVIALVGNDASWAQIAREQVEILGDDVGTVLARTDYHDVAAGFGGAGLLLKDPNQVDAVFKEARTLASQGRPVLINAHIGPSDFRKGSISM